jgi:hypothetical protein
MDQRQEKPPIIVYKFTVNGNSGGSLAKFRKYMPRNYFMISCIAAWLHGLRSLQGGDRS